MGLLAVGWCAKNYAMFGFFGTSSWLGRSVWKVAAHDYRRAELGRLAEAGIVPPMVAEYPRWGGPSRYRAYGFVATSHVPLLARDDQHNINMPAIARVYGAAGLALIRHHPARYARTVARAYVLFSRPSSRFDHLAENAHRIRYLEVFYAEVLQGRGRWLLVLLPAALLLHAGHAVAAIARRRTTVASLVREDAVMTWCFLLIAYATAVTCLLDFGDGARYKFDVEPLLWIFIPVVLLRQLVGPMRDPVGPGAGAHAHRGA
jgi:hypothetical protein